MSLVSQHDPRCPLFWNSFVRMTIAGKANLYRSKREQLLFTLILRTRAHSAAKIPWNPSTWPPLAKHTCMKPIRSEQLTVLDKNHEAVSIFKPFSGKLENARSKNSMSISFWNLKNRNTMKVLQIMCLGNKPTRQITSESGGIQSKILRNIQSRLPPLTYFRI